MSANFADMIFTTASNGFMIEHGYCSRRVFTSFSEAAEYFGEQPSGAHQPVPEFGHDVTHYSYNTSVATLREVRRLFAEKEKIAAIKLLRDAFNPRLGLREAKELVEVLCGGDYE